jgi:hypothetical protein
MSEQKSNINNTICGEVTQVDIIPYGDNKKLARLTLLTLVPKYDGTSEEMVAQLTAFFGKVVEKCEALRVGDYVVCKCKARSSKNKAGYLNWSMVIDTMEVQTNVVPPEQPANQVDDGSDVPF